MKLIKTLLRNHIRDGSLNYLMLIAIESPDVLTDSELDYIVDIWNCRIDCLIV